jgi:hypothetical protein
MLFKYFSEKNTNSSIAINPRNVKYLREISDGGCIISFVDGKEVRVADPYMETATRLSEK